MGLFAGPLLVFNWRRKKSSKYTGFWLLMGLGLGITLIGCSEGPTDWGQQWQGFVAEVRESPTLPPDVVFAPQPWETRERNYIPAIPENQMEYSAMVGAANVFVPGVHPSETACYQTTTAALTSRRLADIVKINPSGSPVLTDEFVALTESYKESARNQAMILVERGMTGVASLNSNTNAVYLFTVSADSFGSMVIDHVHMALMVYFNTSLPLRSIIVQVNGAAKDSGIFYTRLDENPLYKTAQTISSLDWIGVTLP